MEKHLLLAAAYKIMHEMRERHFRMLKAPVYLKVSTNKAWCNKYSAMWELKELNGCPVHEIKLSYFHLLDVAFLKETIIHELVHCQQWEGGKLDTPHNRAFFARLDYVLAQEGMPSTSKEYRKAIKKY